jgi:hypothetical protein
MITRHMGPRAVSSDVADQHRVTLLANRPDKDARSFCPDSADGLFLNQAPGEHGSAVTRPAIIYVPLMSAQRQRCCSTANTAVARTANQQWRSINKLGDTAL